MLSGWISLKFNSLVKSIRTESLPNNRFFNSTKFKALADDKSNTCIIKMIPVFNKIKNIVGKVENTGLQQYLLFPQGIQKGVITFYCVK